MTRKHGVLELEEETASRREEFLRPDLDDTRLLDLDEEDGAPFLRAQKRVPVRRSTLPKKTAVRLKWAGVAALALCALGAVFAFLYNYGEHSWRFRVASSDQIEIQGTQNVSRNQVMEVLGSDLGRNIFFVPLEERRAQLEQIPWVETAAVMRFVPNRLKVEIRERTPVAFVRVGSRIGLIDATGHVMDLPARGKQKYSFPVVAGTSDSEPLSTRAPRMKVFNELVRELDSGGARYSQDLSEVDLSDPEDVKVLAHDPAGEVLVHLGSSSFLERFKVYRSHVQEWRQQFDKLESVDLRYERQIIVNPDLHGAAAKPVLSPAAARAAVAAGVPAIAVTAAKLTEGHARQAQPPSAAKTAPKLVHAPLKWRKRPTRMVAKKAAPKPAATTVRPAASIKHIGPEPLLANHTPAIQKTTPKPGGKPSAGIPKTSND
jgi:cell division protein FtsQ